MTVFKPLFKSSAQCGLCISRMDRISKSKWCGVPWAGKRKFPDLYEIDQIKARLHRIAKRKETNTRASSWREPV